MKYFIRFTRFIDSVVGMYNLHDYLKNSKLKVLQHKGKYKIDSEMLYAEKF